MSNKRYTEEFKIEAVRQVVAFDTGGISDIITHKETGYLVDAFDTEELAVGIQCVIDSLKSSNELQLAARSYALSNYDQLSSANRYLNLYQEIFRVRT